jgi:hypothetical protein
VSLYELFIGELKVPDWMLVRNLDELKSKFTFVIVPVMAVKFLQKILQGESALDVLYYGSPSRSSRRRWRLSTTSPKRANGRTRNSPGRR